MYPRRVIAADARHFGVAILPLDVNRSHKTYRVERCESRSGFGVRLALAEVRDICDAEVESVLSARNEAGPFTSLEDLWRRAELSRPVLENLVHVGALDEVSGGRGRRELLWRAVDLAGGNTLSPRIATKRVRKPQPPAQLALELDEPIAEDLPDLPPYTEHEETQAELEVAGIDATRHVMDLYRPLLAELGCIPATSLIHHRNDSEVWVAGVKVASQTPAIRSGQRIIFLTLDDLTGPLDVTVFERAQPRCARTAFDAWVLLVRGTLRKRGGASLKHRTDPRNVAATIVADEIFDLVEVARHGKEGLSVAEALDRQRARHGGGALAVAEQPKARLWHASGGSSGR